MLTQAYIIFLHIFCTSFVIIVHCPTKVCVLPQFPLIHHISSDLSFVFLVSCHILLYPTLSYNGKMNWQFKASLLNPSYFTPTTESKFFFQCSDSSRTDPLCKLA